MTDENREERTEPDKSEAPERARAQTIIGSPWVCPKCQAKNAFTSWECSECKAPKAM